MRWGIAAVDLLETGATFIVAAGVPLMMGRDWVPLLSLSLSLSLLHIHINGNSTDGPGNLAYLSMEWCIKNGREGRGTIYVWACGNGRANSDNINYDGYANLRYTIPIGSLVIGFWLPPLKKACLSLYLPF